MTVLLLLRLSDLFGEAAATIFCEDVCVYVELFESFWDRGGFEDQQLQKFTCPFLWKVELDFHLQEELNAIEEAFLNQKLTFIFSQKIAGNFLPEFQQKLKEMPIDVPQVFIEILIEKYLETRVALDFIANILCPTLHKRHISPKVQVQKLKKLVKESFLLLFGSIGFVSTLGVY